MGKSLTEVAKSILMKESNDAEPYRDVNLNTVNKVTLKAGSKSVDPNPMSNDAELIADAPKKVGEGDNVGAKASGKLSKDTSVKQGAPAQKADSLSEEEAEDGDVVAEGTGGGKAERPRNKDMDDAIAKFKGKITKVPMAGSKKKKESKEEEKNELHEEEELEEDLENVEISEELEAFIDQCLEEGMDEDQIAEAIDANFEFVTESDDSDGDTGEEVNEEEAEAADYDYTVDMTEHVEALFAGEDLSEEFKAKAIAIFEAAVTSKVKSELAALEEAYAQTLEEEITTIKEELSSNVDDYLNYVVEQWVSDNEVAIEASLRTELTEEFISGLKNLFAENYIDIPEDKVSVIEELGSRVSELETKLNEEIERNVELTSILSESRKSEILHTVVEGLTTTQAERLKSLAEGVEFTTEAEYAHKVSTLRESYFPTSITAQGELDKIEAGTEGKTMISEELQGPMAAYVRTLGRKLPN